MLVGTDIYVRLPDLERGGGGFLIKDSIITLVYVRNWVKWKYRYATLSTMPR